MAGCRLVPGSLDRCSILVRGPSPSWQLLRLLPAAVLPAGERQELRVLQALHGAEAHPALPCPHGLPVHLRGPAGGFGARARHPEAVHESKTPLTAAWRCSEPSPPKRCRLSSLVSFTPPRSRELPSFLGGKLDRDCQTPLLRSVPSFPGWPVRRGPDAAESHRPCCGSR